MSILLGKACAVMRQFIERKEWALVIGPVGVGKSLFWFAFNTNKRGITLNLGTRDGQEIFKSLVRKVDFVIESLPIGFLEQLSLGYNELNQINPQLIMTSITGFGQTGPYGAYTDQVAPKYLLVAVMAALLHRRHTGRGQYMEQPQVEAGLNFLAPALLDYATNGVVESCPGNREPNAAPRLIRKRGVKLKNNGKPHGE